MRRIKKNRHDLCQKGGNVRLSWQHVNLNASLNYANLLIFHQKTAEIMA